MSKLHINIMTPEAQFLECEADAVILPLSDGGYEILPGHTPVALALDSGFISIKSGDKWREVWTTEGIARFKDGVADVFADNCAFTESGLTLDEKLHFAKMQNEKQSVMEHEQSKIELTRVIAGLKKKKNNRNI